MIGKTKRKFPHGGTYEGSFRAHQGFVQDDELKVQRHRQLVQYFGGKLCAQL